MFFATTPAVCLSLSGEVIRRSLGTCSGSQCCFPCQAASLPAVCSRGSALCSHGPLHLPTVISPRLCVPHGAFRSESRGVNRVTVTQQLAVRLVLVELCQYDPRRSADSRIAPLIAEARLTATSAPINAVCRHCVFFGLARPSQTNGELSSRERRLFRRDSRTGDRSAIPFLFDTDARLERCRRGTLKFRGCNITRVARERDERGVEGKCRRAPPGRQLRT